MHGLELVKKGAIWRIGNGRSVRIWRDPWIPREFSNKVIFPRGRCRLCWVSELITPRREWDKNLLLSYFNPMDVKAILKVKISHRPMEDFVAWSRDNSGIFTVRSAYNLALYLKNEHVTGCSSASADGERKLWQHIWSGAIPHKVKIFSWKLSKDALCTKANKVKRNMEKEATCELCGMTNETSFHAVVECPLAFDLRQAMRQRWSLPKEELFRYTGPDWFLLLLDRLTEDQRDWIKLIFWRAWNVHNNVTHNSGPSNISSSVQFLLQYMNSLLQVRQYTVEEIIKGKIPTGGCRKQSKKEVPLEQSIWKPPVWMGGNWD